METNNCNIIWSEIALSDLQNIYFFLAQKSVYTANTTIDNIYNRTNQLIIKGFAESCQIDNINPNYRRLIEGNYKILYSINQDQITIHGVFDCRQNPKKLKNKSL